VHKAEKPQIFLPPDASALRRFDKLSDRKLNDRGSGTGLQHFDKLSVRTLSRRAGKWRKEKPGTATQKHSPPASFFHPGFCIAEPGSPTLAPFDFAQGPTRESGGYKEFGLCKRERIYSLNNLLFSTITFFSASL
jgi:hypothetical protein